MLSYRGRGGNRRGRLENRNPLILEIVLCCLCSCTCCTLVFLVLGAVPALCDGEKNISLMLWGDLDSYGLFVGCFR